MSPINDNQLREAIRSLLEVAAEPCTEYQLIQQLNDQGWSLPTNASDPLQMFSSHFLVFNALYQLQHDYWQQQRYLQVSALVIQIHPEANDMGEGQGLADYSGDQALRDYYLDWNNLETATEESVNKLLNQFWERYIAADDSTRALEILSLQMPITLGDVKQRYRSLAMEHHPDRGGDSEQFQQINWAFGVLQKHIG